MSYFVRIISPGEDQAEFSRGISSALGMQGLALLCTAIYQTFRNELTLFHAICVVHLLALLGINLISKGRYTGFGPWRLWFSSTIHILSLAAFVAFNVHLWITAPHFGNQPACNQDTVYVVFGISINATSPVFRYVILGTLASIAASWILLVSCMLPCLCGVWVLRKRDPEAGSQPARKRGCINWLVRTSRSTQTRAQRAPQRLRGQALLNFTLNKLAYCGFCIYLIVSLEQTIHRNTLDPEEEAWTFGQVIAIFLLLGVANELLNLVLASWDRKIGQGEGSEGLAQDRPGSSDGHSLHSVPSQRV